MASDIELVLSESAIHAVLGVNGLVGPMLARVGVFGESRAKYYASGNEGGPNVDTGRFRSSLTWRLGEDGEGPYVEIGSNVEYAAFLELGTSRMAARPSIIPAAREAAAHIGA